MEKSLVRTAVEAYTAVRFSSEGDSVVLEKKLDRAVAAAARSNEPIPADLPGGLWGALTLARERICFARGVRAKLVVPDGLSEVGASVLIRACGPGAALRALQWAQKIRRAGFGADAVTLALSATPAFGVERQLAALEELGFPPPPVEDRRLGFGPSARDLDRLCAGVVTLFRHDEVPE